MDKISFVVPVYNVERYVTRCVSSLIKQTYSNIEIVLVDDGSTDSSGNLCESFKAKDERITVIHQKNGGLSAARNKGIRCASGDYIVLIDGDDFVHPQMAEILHNVAIASKADMVICKMQFIDEKNIPEDPVFKTYPENCIFESVQHPNIYKQLWEKDVETVVQWNKLFRRNVIKKCHYPLGRYHEDVFVIHEILANCQKIAYIQKKLYYYVQREGSIMHLESPKMMADAIAAYESRYQFFKEKKLNYEAKMTIKSKMKYLLWRSKEMVRKQNLEHWDWLIDIYKKQFQKDAIYCIRWGKLVLFYLFPNLFKKYYELKNRN